MDILNLGEAKNPEWWIRQIADSDWTAGPFLADLLRTGKFRDMCGEKAEVLLLTDGSSLVSYCTYAEKDDVPGTELTPWMGFVYTAPEYRGRRLMQRLIGRVKEKARADGYDAVYISTGEEGLYEKYGAVFQTFLKDMRGEESRIYRMDTYGFAGWESADIQAQTEEYPGIRTPKDLYNALWDLWSADTCAPRLRAGWSRQNRTLGQCTITAFLAQDIFGGKVYGIPLEEGGAHCYNAVGDCVFDLTSEQFSGKALTYDRKNEQLRYEHFRKEEKRERYERLKAALTAATRGSGRK